MGSTTGSITTSTNSKADPSSTTEPTIVNSIAKPTIVNISSAEVKGKVDRLGFSLA